MPEGECSTDTVCLREVKVLRILLFTILSSSTHIKLSVWASGSKQMA